MNFFRENSPVWLETDAMPKFFPLSGDVYADVCVVGGGIAGLTTAYLLMKEGKKVCVVEAMEIGGGQSCRTTAQFCTALDDRYFELEKLHGEAGSKLAAESHRAAIEQVEKIVRAENIECEMRRVDGFLFAQGDSRSDVLQKEHKALLNAGITNVEMLTQIPGLPFDSGPCIRFGDQLELHPVKYMAGLAKAIIDGGGLIFNKTHVNQVQGGNAAFVKTDSGYFINCESVVVATNSPVNDLFAIHTKQAPYRTYVIGCQIPKGSIPAAFYWDTLDPYHYIRIEQSPNDVHDLLIVGGEDHKTGQEEHPELRYRKLEEWTRARFPMMTEVIYQWSGQVMEPVDALGFLGHNPMDQYNVYVITGDSGNGMTHTTIGAMMITDLIMNQQNAWTELYDPSRISLRSIGEFIKENANVAAQYEDWLAAKPRPDYLDLVPREGQVFRDGLKMVAVYKDEVGNLEFMSAACPHLGGVVHWNSAEKSWDCPCHGSRFDCHGQVIEGPAVSNLEKVNIEAPELVGPVRVAPDQLTTNPETAF
ncbi:MAG: FAD-dependent oxidoreductase [Pseudobdellovibrio sp.]|jgi:glycine/D-amino acid oxidase-like deaminating enzyme/nitrite reductase/ring-hydroxylating ferredoxin subunit|nr:FAD-dependent oxidoreductase [Pseudobdellovibrio sp.]